jgi:acyl-CoA reductase-like NAD-dependent aldehyde dehydrogenase
MEFSSASAPGRSGAVPGLADGEPPALVIDGEPRPGDRPSYAVVNPARPSEVVVDAPAASLEQLEQAVAGARRALRAWMVLGLDERARLVEHAAAAATSWALEVGLERRFVAEHGKVLAEATFEVASLGGMAPMWAGFAKEVLAGRRIGEGPRATEVQLRPHGVVAAILPFNWPIALFGTKVLPALLAGNAVVVKAPPTCPGALLGIAVATARELPPGILQVLSAPDPGFGAALVGHAGVDMVTFTGSVATGQAVWREAAGKPIVLELGGNDPAIVAPDFEADDDAIQRLLDATFATSGQVCMAIKRLYVHRSRLDELLERLVARLEASIVGDGLAEGVTMGPLHRPEALERARRLIDEAAARGGRVIALGQIRPQDEQAGGWFLRPTLVVDPPDDCALVAEEQFAPVLPVLTYDDLDEAVARANATRFGLTASVWTADARLARRVADALEAGTVFVNGHGMAEMEPQAPFGGWKDSGVGLELGPEGVAAFVRPKVVGGRPWPKEDA